MKKILIAAICVLAVLVGIIAVDAVITGSKKEEGVEIVSHYTDGDVRKTTVEIVATKDRNAQEQFTMPLQYKSDFELFCSENKYDYTVVSADEATQTFTVSMRAWDHDMMLTLLGMRTISGICAAMDSKEYPFFKELGGYNDNFSEIIVIVDEAAYSAAADTEAFTAFIAAECIYRQFYTMSNDYSCQVIVKGQTSGETIDAQLYRQNNSGVIS